MIDINRFYSLIYSTKKGNRPGFTRSARSETAIPLYEKFLSELQVFSGKEIKAGTFGADMKIALVNDGPVTIICDSRHPE